MLMPSNVDDKGKVDVNGKYVVNGIVNFDVMETIDDIGRSDHDADVKGNVFVDMKKI